MASLRAILAGTLCLAGTVGAIRPLWGLGDLKRMDAEYDVSESGRTKIRSRGDEPRLSDRYPAHILDVPVDHFHNDSRYEPHSNETFGLRYWFDASHYRRGGPVIVLQGGETSGANRLPFLQKGIVAILAEATGGLGVILEHRYYGKSYVTPNFTTENMRFLSTDQAMADMAYFAKNIAFPGFEDFDLTAPDTPYIAYGGSYAGAMVAFLRKLYPDVYMGAIASSAVTEAIYDYWEYFEAARLFAPPGCALATQKFTDVIDKILIERTSQSLVKSVKDVFGLGNLTNDKDFVNSLTYGIGSLQDTNWDPAHSSPRFYEYCNNVTSNDLLYPSLGFRESEVMHLLNATGYDKEITTLTIPFLNYVGFVNLTTVHTCIRRESDIESCLGSSDHEFYQRVNLTSGRWRSWPYQYCTEWGYLTTGSGVPKHQLPLISRLLDIDYAAEVCREAFNITKPPDLGIINKHGGFNLSYPRLAFIDGEKDPWRAATPHRIGLPERKSTVSEPFLLIKDGVHHWDENGLFANETRPGFPPKAIVEVQKAEVEFVKAWLVGWAQGRQSAKGSNHVDIEDYRDRMSDL